MIRSKAAAALLRLKEIDKKYKVRYDDRKRGQSSASSDSLLQEIETKKNTSALVKNETQEISKPTLNIRIPDTYTEGLESQSSKSNKVSPSLRISIFDKSPNSTPRVKSKSVSETQESLDNEESISEIFDESHHSDSKAFQDSEKKQCADCRSNTIGFTKTVEESISSPKEELNINSSLTDNYIDDYNSDSFENYSSDFENCSSNTQDSQQDQELQFRSLSVKSNVQEQKDSNSVINTEDIIQSELSLDDSNKVEILDNVKKNEEEISKAKTSEINDERETADELSQSVKDTCSSTKLDITEESRTFQKRRNDKDQIKIANLSLGQLNTNVTSVFSSSQTTTETSSQSSEKRRRKLREHSVNVGVMPAVSAVELESSSRCGNSRGRTDETLTSNNEHSKDTVPKIVEKTAVRKAKSSPEIPISIQSSNDVGKKLIRRRKRLPRSAVYDQAKSHKLNIKKSKSAKIYREKNEEYFEYKDRELERLRMRMNYLRLEQEREMMLSYTRNFEAANERLLLWPRRLTCPLKPEVPIIKPLDFPNVANFTKSDKIAVQREVLSSDIHLEILRNRVMEIRQWLKDQLILYREYSDVATAINAKYISDAEAEMNYPNVMNGISTSLMTSSES